MTGRLGAAACCLALAAGCGGPGQVVVTTGQSEPPATAPLAEQIAADERLAASILVELLSDDDPHLSAWAAVHTFRLGLKVDEAVREEALRRCLLAPETDSLLRACCWRWASALGAEAVAKIPAPQEPVAEVLAALAEASRGAIREELVTALVLDTRATTRGEPRSAAQATSAYLAGALPFDDAPVALALAFVDAKRAGWLDAQTTGEPIPLAVRLRALLMERLGVSAPVAKRDVAAATPVSASPIGALLMGPLSGRSLEELRGLCLHAPPALQEGALQALAIAAVPPSALDLGAAAASLRSPSARVRLEAARTFLLLSIRAHTL